ncbi:multimeric flavodoxin WrbA [Methanococcus voltae]|uniref:Multimeric flavodoxin WrbA n=1 Tax=Methanococcus voltae TaxID=2188 RepID=A0A8J7RH07_METVO|nr:flavodoxin family protein [Methanococcus voltae]MBP2201340.1 multimeric flavodoxin WrbA [Methanococcus voltae]
MKILGISGSPRLEGTDFAVQHALTYLSDKCKTNGIECETKYITVARKELNFCIHCDHCIRKKQGCVHKDSMQEVYEALKWADGIIMGTPCYNGNVSGQLKTVMDRCRALFAMELHAIRDKYGMGISVGGDRNGGQEVALKTIHDFYILNGALPVSGGSFGSNLGATFWSRDLGREGVENDTEGARVLKRTLNKFYNELSKK